MHYLVLVNLYQRMNRSIYQKRRQCAHTLFLVNLPYYINKAIRIHVFYHPCHQYCIIWVMHMRQNISSGMRKSVVWKSTIKVRCTSDVIFLWDITKKKPKKPNYCIEEWHASTPYDIFRNQATYPTVCLLLYTWHLTDNCIRFLSKWIFDSNLKVALPLIQDCLSYTCCGNGTNDNKFVGVLHAIRAVHPEVVQRRLNLK